MARTAACSQQLTLSASNVWAKFPRAGSSRAIVKWHITVPPAGAIHCLNIAKVSGNAFIRPSSHPHTNLYPFGPMYRLLLLTVCRRGEWAKARWPWLEIGERWLEIPAEAYKSERVHVVPLVEPALEVIETLLRIKNPPDRSW